MTDKIENALQPVPIRTFNFQVTGTSEWGEREGGRTLRKDVFLPSKHLLSAFYETLPSKNPSKNLVLLKTPYRRLLRSLLRSTYL